MNRPSPSDARNKIVEVLGESVYHALGLKESLQEEHSALEVQDAEALHDAVSIKSGCVTKLSELERQRSDLCEASGFHKGPEQMAQMSEWCDENSVVANCWDHLIEIAADCNALNLTNGAIIRVRRQQTDDRLAVLRGTDNHSETYGRGGAETAAMTQRALAKA